MEKDKTLTSLLKTINDLVSEIHLDTNRTKLPTLSVKLLEFSEKYWETKQNYIQKKNEYEREFVMKKESWKIYLENQAKLRHTKELEANPKAKLEKITSVETDAQTSLELLKLNREVSDLQWVVAYMEPVLKWYYEIIQVIKFMDRANVEATKVFSQLPPF